MKLLVDFIFQRLSLMSMSFAIGAITFKLYPTMKVYPFIIFFVVVESIRPFLRKR